MSAKQNSRDLSWETLRYDGLVIEIMRKVAGLANHRSSHVSAKKKKKKISCFMDLDSAPIRTRTRMPRMRLARRWSAMDTTRLRAVKG